TPYARRNVARIASLLASSMTNISVHDQYLPFAIAAGRAQSRRRLPPFIRLSAGYIGIEARSSQVRTKRLPSAGPISLIRQPEDDRAHARITTSATNELPRYAVSAHDQWQVQAADSLGPQRRAAALWATKKRIVARITRIA